MAANLFSFSFLLFISLGVSLTMGGTQRNHYVFRVSSLLPKTVCSPFEGGRNMTEGSTLSVVNRHGPCSPFARGREKKISVEQMLQEDEARVDSLRSRIYGRGSYTQQKQASLKAKSTTLPARSGRSLNTGNFIVTIGLGTPKSDMSVIFDTGSDLTWIQCEPCVSSCYSQQDKIFDPSASSTYLNVSCTSPDCSQLTSATGYPSGCSSSTCLYAISYGDQSYSVGFFGHETLTLTSTDVFPNFLFGCGEKNQGLFGSAAGLLGLGRNKLSMVSQTSHKYGGVFSYCLPPSSSSTGYLTFGGYKAMSSLKFTPLLTDANNPSFYFLDLIGIAVGGRKLPISASVFSTAGTLIDSGTVITRLPPSAYAALRSAFRQAMSKYPSAPAISILDTCFDLSGYNTISVPKIQLQYRGGVNMDVDFTGIMVAASASQVCLAFAGNSDAGDVAIIGNKQQQTMEVVYNVAKGVIGFGSGGCS